MWDLLRKFNEARRNKDFASIVAVAEQLADLIGISREVKELVELVEAVRAGDWSAVCRNAGEFLIVIAEQFTAQYGFSIMFAVDDPEAKIDAMIDAMESGAVPPVVGDAAEEKPKENVLPAVLIILQIARLFWQWRNK